MRLFLISFAVILAIIAYAGTAVSLLVGTKSWIGVGMGIVMVAAGFAFEIAYLWGTP